MAKAIIPTMGKLEKLLQMATREVIIYTPFFSNTGLRVVSTLNDSVSLEFCTRLKLFDWLMGASDPSRLATILSNLRDKGHEVKIFVHQRLHAKAYYADRALGMVGSANLSQGGFGANVEVMLLVRGQEAAETIDNLERQFRPGASQISLEQLNLWVEENQGRIKKLKLKNKNLRDSLLDAQSDADLALGLTGGIIYIPIPTREMCDHFADWLRANSGLGGAQELYRHATDTKKLRRQGHFRKCFGAIYRFLNEYPHWQPVLAGQLGGLLADDYFDPSTEMRAEWRRHVGANAGLVENEVCNYIMLQGILPPKYGGSRNGGGGGVSTLRRMYPLLAYYLEAGMI